MRRLIPYSLLAVLVLWAGVFTLISYKQSTASGSSIQIPLTCTKGAGVKPTSFVISCADANSEFTDLHWTGWGDETAYATGVARWNDCTPTCVAGHWRSEPVTLWAWDPQNDVYTKLASSDPRLLGTAYLWKETTAGTFQSS
ncbi:MAG: hypothetical protein WA860_06185 [Acidimicrobiales bacterium]